MESKTKKIKYYELFNINKGLEELNGIAGVQLGMYRGKLSRVVKEYIEDIQSFTKTEEWVRIDKGISEINKKYCIKDAEGSPIISDGKYTFTADAEKVRAEEVKEFKLKEKESLDRRVELEKEYNALLPTVTPFEITVIPYSVIKEVEDTYIKMGKISPFKSETIDLLISIIDMEI